MPQYVIDEAYERDPAVAAAEYGAEFRTDVERLLTREAVGTCVNPGIFERPPLRTLSYVGFTDPSGGAQDAFTLAIAHFENKTAVLDLVRERQPPFSPEAVIEEYAGVLKKYRVTTAKGDRYAGEFPVEQFRKHGINFEPAERSKSELYGDLVAVINSRGCDLLDNSRLIGQLIGLERRTRNAGRDQIDHAPGAHDDLANAVAGVVLEASKAPPSNFLRTIVYRETAPA